MRLSTFLSLRDSYKPLKKINNRLAELIRIQLINEEENLNNLTNHE